ncbi:MAG TPA: hypothetical protein VHE34_08950 [Puia sp.]|uniref:hypothetical protein n=1 Tax=Puia sp. TaxID=2045100 RepID=UPI002C6BBFCF|nr:hypothetical protein [Puia sp.]HVU95339.1 hypothetical protein [Puia sp.]
MPIRTETKKIIATDWLKAFPELSGYAQNKFYRIAGCVLLGLELIKLPRSEEYRPHFVMYPLWEENPDKCFTAIILVQEFYTKRNQQFSIPYENHTLIFNEVLISVGEQKPILSYKEISIGHLLGVMESYARKAPLSATTNSFHQAKFREAILKINLYEGRKETEALYREIVGINWDKIHFKAYGVDVDDWLQKVHECINRREDFLRQIEQNKLDKKFGRLSWSYRA